MLSEPTYTIQDAERKLAYNHFLLTFWGVFSLLFVYMNIFAGPCILVLRQLGKSYKFSLCIYGVLFFIVLVYSLRLSIKKSKIKSDKWLALIDDYNEAGGIVVSSAETGDDKWIKYDKKKYKIPELVYKNKRHKSFVFLSLAFCAVCVLVPLKKNSDTVKQSSFKEIVQKDKEKIELLKDIEALSEKDALRQLEALNNISENVSKNGVNKSYEALDRIRENMKHAAGSVAAKIAQEKQSLSELENKLSDIKEHNGINSSDLKRMISEAGINDHKITESDAKKASEELKKYIDERNKKLNSNLDKLAESGLIGEKTGNIIAGEKNESFGVAKKHQTSGMSGTNSDATAKEAGANSSEGKNSNGDNASGMAEQNLAGKSGEAGKDGGSAPLLFNRRTSLHDVGYKDSSVQSNTELNPDDYISAGTVFSSPEPHNGKITEKKYNNNVEIFEKIKATRYDRETILPKHRKTVIKYFGNNGAK